MNSVTRVSEAFPSGGLHIPFWIITGILRKERMDGKRAKGFQRMESMETERVHIGRDNAKITMLKTTHTPPVNIHLSDSSARS